MIMHVDDAGIKLIAAHEGVRLKSYRDSTGKWTIGYGHTATAHAGQSITKQQALNLLREDLAVKEDCVEQYVVVPLTQGQFNALVSLAYNIGCGGFRKSSVLELINKGRYQEAANAMKSYNRAGGKVLAGLTTRRAAEVAMFTNGSNSRTTLFADAVNFIFGGSVKTAFQKG